jgi:hypothetical protein
MAMEPKRHKEIVDILQEIEHYLTEVTAEIERSAPVNQSHAYTLLAAEHAVKALAHLRHMLADTSRQ